MKDNMANSVDRELLAYISNNILPRYGSYDKAHGPGHISAVITGSMNICNAIRTGAMSTDDADGNPASDKRIPEPDMVYTIAAYHDLGICEGRENHHISSGRMLMEDGNLRKWFDEGRMEEMKEAIEDHRASGGHRPRSIYGRIVSEADRLIDPDTVISRCILYGKENFPELDAKSQFERCYSHIRNKYGDNGYLKLQFRDSENVARLEYLRSLIRNPLALKEEYSLFETHPLPPFIPDNARILLLGSFPPPAARWSMDFFYPNFINDMWRIMGLIYYGDRNRFVTEGRKAFDKEAITDFCAKEGIALYDAAYMVKRTKGNASDNFLKIIEPSDLGTLLQSMPDCRAIASTGGKSAETIADMFSVQVPPVGGHTEIKTGKENRKLLFYRMPSTSRAYPMPLEEKARHYAGLLTGNFDYI